MKIFFKILLYIVSYFLLTFVMTVIFGLLELLDSYSWVVVILPIFILIIFANRKKIFKLNSKTSSFIDPASENTTRAPEAKTKKEHLPNAKKCREICDSLLAVAKQNIDFSHNASSITQYFIFVIKARETLEQAIKYEEKAGYDTSESPSYISNHFENEFQWRLRDAIEREESTLNDEILGPQHNNRNACCQEFLNEIEQYKSQFSEESLQYAMNAYHHICYMAGLSSQTIENNENAIPIELVDKMDGHQFEYFCADILKKNGFSNVEVTKGSGDQGIDILAEKDDIKYAIQCKCYSSDLGNKPVQEAFAGKSIYNCQIAAVLTNRFFTQGGIEAARATGVLLWDRNKLQYFIDNAK